MDNNRPLSRSNEENRIHTDERIIWYIKQELKKGYSQESIKDALVRAGHNPMHIVHHFDRIQKQKTKRIFIFLFLAFTLLVFIYFFAVLLQQNGENNSENFDKAIKNGIKLCDMGIYDKAIENFDYAIGLNETSLRGYAWKGWCFVKQGRYNESIAELKKAEHLGRVYQPGFSNSIYYKALGEAYCGKGDYENGINQIKIAISLNSSNSDFYHSLGDCYFKKGDAEKGSNYLNISLQLSRIIN
ncbi:hypothetical protein HYX05_04005 [Candidatus Woesearchaeota archaeon]|nr:hypothetical protein [Candidatus Woesearchaeota archaeon]